MVSALRKAGVDQPALDARLLFCAALGIEPVDLMRDPMLEVSASRLDRLELMLARRQNREPVSRILGKRGFWSLDLIVTPDVLDPRADSETIISAAIACFVETQNEPLAIADLGVGSGALLCALLEVFPSARGVGVDISSAACAVTRANLMELDQSARAEIRCGPWLAAQPGPYDLIVSNPPYIPSAEIERLDPEVRNFDPRLALDGGADGLDAYRELTGILPGLLAKKGRAILEIGFDQAEAVQQLIVGAGMNFVGLHRDLSGLPRAVSATLAN